MCTSYQFENGEAQPGALVPVVREFDGPRESLHMRWGLIPYAARGDPGAAPVIHAPLAELLDSHVYRGPWINGQRCLHPATSFPFWKTDRQGHRRCFRARAANQAHFVLAGLWDRSQPPQGAMIESCALVTLPGGIPVILEPANLTAWLTGTAEQAAALLRPFPLSHLHLTPV